jgi:tetratricopeptide (TPR) repeat protein
MSDDLIHGLIEVPKSEVQILLEAGYLYMEMGLFKECEDVFAGVSALLPESDVPRVALGNLFFAQGKFQRALKFHQEALKAFPESAIAQAHIGESLLFLKKLDEAKKALKKAIDMEPRGPAGVFAKALLDAHDAGELSS